VACGAVKTERNIKGKTTRETRYFLLSEPLVPDQLLTKVRKHWRIENSLHWVLDVTMNEGQQRTRTGYGGLKYSLDATHGGQYGTRGTGAEKVLHAQQVETSRMER